MFGISLVILGVLFIIIAVFGYFTDKKKFNNVIDMRAKTLSTVAEILENYEMLGNAKIERQFYRMAEIEGTISNKKVLESPVDKDKCIFYDTEIYRVLENKEDKKQEKEKIWDEKKYTNFYLQDSSGEIAIKVDNNDIKTDIANLAKVTKEGFVQDIPKSINITPASSKYKLVGYEVKEKTVLSQTPLYIYGEVNDRDTELMIAPPHQTGKLMLISNLPKQDFIKNLRADIQTGKVLAPLFIILGGLLIWWGGNVLDWF